MSFFGRMLERWMFFMRGQREYKLYPSQMLSRWYLFMFAVVLTVFGIGGLVYAYNLPGGISGLVYVDRMPGFNGAIAGTSILWLFSAALALAIAFGVPDRDTVRAAAGAAGLWYFAWGTVYLFLFPFKADISAYRFMALAAGLMIFLGGWGLASMLVPIFWKGERYKVSAHAFP